MGKNLHFMTILMAILGILYIVDMIVSHPTAPRFILLA